MSINAKVENGAIRLPEDVNLPDGTTVRIEVIAPAAAADLSQEEPTTEGDQTRPTLYEQFAEYIGIAKGLPPDFAINHDHYLHGAPKQQPWSLYLPTLFISSHCLIQMINP